MKVPKILALLPFLVKGALSIEIFRALRAGGMEITVAFYEDASATYEVDALQDFQATGDLLDLSAAFGVERLNLIDDIIGSRGIDLIVQVGAGELYHLLPYLKERRPALRIVDILYNEVGHTLNHFLYERIIDAVIVESEFMGDFVKRSSAKHDTHVEIVHSGVDLQEFAPDEQRVTPPALKVGYVGRMSAEKNPMGFIELAEKLGRMNPKLDFEMFGTGGEAASVQERVAGSDIASRLTYHGFVEHARDALLRLDVLVLPSKFDGRPMIIMEANGCGIPVIAAPVGGIPELVRDGINGFLMQPTDADRIHALIAKWQQDPNSLAAQKRAARSHAQQYFDRQRMIEAYTSAFIRVSAL